MTRSFSVQAGGILDSFIMQLAEEGSKPGMISFATGLPDSSLFDLEGLAGSAREIVLRSGKEILQYGSTAGYYPLRERLAGYCRRKLGFDASPENIILTNGSQECFDLVGRLFLNRGDLMAVENPGYLGAKQCFSAYGPRFKGVDIGPGGIDVPGLEALVKEGAALFYSIPNHQNPSGYSYSDQVRRETASIISGSDCVLVEDDAYGELGFSGRAGRTMKSMAPDNIIFTGSFSKILSPAMRIGWMAVPGWMAGQAVKTLEASSLQPGTLCQAIAEDYLSKTDYGAYVRRLRKVYRGKMEIFTDLMEDYLKDYVTWNIPDGGMFIWMKSPEGTDAMRIYRSCIEKGLAVMPGEPFHISGGKNTIRLNFATPSEEQMRAGMKILRSACQESDPRAKSGL